MTEASTFVTGNSMRRILLLIVCAMMSLSVGVSSTAHAAESGVCIEQAAAHAEDADDNRDARGETGKSVPDQHFNCHAHQYAALGAHEAMPLHPHARTVPAPAKAHALFAATTDPALRPPQA